MKIILLLMSIILNLHAISNECFELKNSTTQIFVNKKNKKISIKRFEINKTIFGSQLKYKFKVPYEQNIDDIEKLHDYIKISGNNIVEGVGLEYIIHIKDKNASVTIKYQFEERSLTYQNDDFTLHDEQCDKLHNN